MANNSPEFFAPGEEPETERTEVGEVGASALAILNQSEHAAMVTTANLPTNKRKLQVFDEKLMSYANHSQAVALSMFYSLPRAGKQIIGASIRFAEIVVPCWKNCAAATRMIGDSRETVTAQGVYIDYEANIRISVEIPRRITDKNGNRYNADMIVTTANAASSIAYRNAVLRGVPRALWAPAYEEAKLTAVGKAKSLSESVAAALEYLTKMGVTEWLIYNSVGVASSKELEMEHIVTLRVLCEEIKRRDKTIEEVFGSPYDKEIDALFGQLKMNATQQRLLRDSHMGHAKDLLDHLKGRLEPSTRAAKAEAPKPEESPATNGAAPQPAQAQESTEAPKRGRGRPRKEAVSAQETVAEEPEAEQEPIDEATPPEEKKDDSGKFNF